MTQNILFEELKKVLLYVKGQIDFKQVYCVKPGSKLELTFVCDADYSGDRPSTFGGLGWLNDCMIYAHSSTIKTAVTSSTESEAHSIFEFTKMGIYCANWITELVGYVLRPVYVFNDNASAILILTTRTTQPSRSISTSSFDMLISNMNKIMSRLLSYLVNSTALICLHILSVLHPLKR